jgi:integrase
VAKYKGTYNLLKSFADKKRKGKLDWQNIDMDFYFDFTDFLKFTHNHSPNTIGKYVKTLKVFLREAIEAGFDVPRTFENRKFSAPSEKVEHIYLTEDELTKIYELDLTKRPALEAQRDLFIIACYTGLRFSDFTTLKPENIIQTESGNAIKKATYKTGEVVLIPLHYRVEAILMKYENRLPRAISNQKMNQALKTIGKLAGIDTDFTTTKTIGNLSTTITQPKYELISTHCGRRSFATNAFKAGIPAISIMKITGHKTESVFLKYINLTNEENANLLTNHSFFRKPQMKVV